MNEVKNECENADKNVKKVIVRRMADRMKGGLARRKGLGMAKRMALRIEGGMARRKG